MVLAHETFKQLLQGSLGVAEERGRPKELLAQDPTGLPIHGAPKVVAQLEGILDAHLAGRGERQRWDGAQD